MKFMEFIRIKEELPRFLLERTGLSSRSMREDITREYNVDSVEMRGYGSKDIMLVRKDGVTFVYDFGRRHCSFRELRRR